MADQEHAYGYAHQGDRQKDPQKHAVQPGDTLFAFLRLRPGIKSDISEGEAEVHQVQIVHHGLHQLVQAIFILPQDPDHKRIVHQVHQDRDSLGHKGEHDALADLSVHCFLPRR